MEKVKSSKVSVWIAERHDADGNVLAVDGPYRDAKAAGQCLRNAAPDERWFAVRVTAAVAADSTRSVEWHEPLPIRYHVLDASLADAAIAFVREHVARLCPDAKPPRFQNVRAQWQNPANPRVIDVRGETVSELEPGEPITEEFSLSLSIVTGGVPEFAFESYLRAYTAGVWDFDAERAEMVPVEI